MPVNITLPVLKKLKMDRIERLHGQYLSHISKRVFSTHRPFRSFSTLRAPVTMDLMESIARQTSFAVHLSKHVGATVASDCNLVFSPLSAHLVLALVAAGSKGRTLDETLSFLGHSSGELADLNSLSSQIVALVLADGSASGGPRVSFANGVFVDSSMTLKPSFNDIVTNTFKAEVKAVDFRTKVRVSFLFTSF